MKTTITFKKTDHPREKTIKWLPDGTKAIIVYISREKMKKLFPEDYE